MCKIKIITFLTFILLSITLSAQMGGEGGTHGGGPGAQRFPDQRQSNTMRNMASSEVETAKIGILTGIVFDQKANIPIEYATIALIDPSTKKVVTGGITNNKGVFTIKHIPQGKYTVEITYIGFGKVSMNDIAFSSSKKTQDLGRIILKESQNILQDMTVQADFTTIENRIDKQVVNVGKDLMAAGASARDVFSNLPMVDVDFDGNISLRGSDNVRVLLDNRPSNMSVADLIESLPADAIDKVEIITNPSAKQDPDGMSGIINIITKKGILYGLNFSARVGVDTKNKWNGGVNLGYYYGKIMVYANYSFRYNSMNSSSETFRGNYRPSTVNPDPYLNYQQNYNSNSMTSHSLRAGIDYLPNKKTALSYSLNWNPSQRSSISKSSSYFLPLDIPMSDLTKEIATQIVADHQDDLDNYFDRYRNSSSDRSSNTIRNTLNFRRDYSTNEYFEAGASYEMSDAKNPMTIFNRLPSATTNENSANSTTNKMLDVSIDYSKEVRGKFKLEVGAKVNVLSRDMPYFYYIDEVPDMNRSNHFKYDQTLISAYATYSRRFNNFTMQLGLRAEETIYTSLGLGIEHKDGGIVYVEDNDMKIDRNYFSVYPSLGLMYKFGDSNDISFNYSRRVSRPGSDALNPTPRFSDPLYVTVGNPYLDPSFTNSLQAQWSKRINGNKGTVNVSAFFRNSTDMMQRITQRQDPTDASKPEGDVLYTTTINMGSQYSLGMNLYFSYKFFPWWNINLMSSYYYDEKDIPNKTNYIRSSNSFSARMNNSFNISSWGTRMQFSMRYNTPRATLQGASSAMFMADGGVSQDFLKKKMSVSVRVSDIFNTMTNRNSTYGDDYVMFSNSQIESRVVNLSVSYRFADMKFKDKRMKGLNGSGEELPTTESSTE